MSISLRIMLIVCSILMVIYVGRQIRASRMRVGDGLVWLLMTGTFVIISIWPQIIYRICNAIGIMSPTNLVYLLVIAFLVLLVFFNAMKISTLESRLDHLAQEVALRDERFVGLETEDQIYVQQRQKEQ